MLEKLSGYLWGQVRQSIKVVSDRAEVARSEKRSGRPHILCQGGESAKQFAIHALHAGESFSPASASELVRKVMRRFRE